MLILPLSYLYRLYSKTGYDTPKMTEKMNFFTGFSVHKNKYGLAAIEFVIFRLSAIMP
jgi:hypothetical protein